MATPPISWHPAAEFEAGFEGFAVLKDSTNPSYYNKMRNSFGWLFAAALLKS